MDNLSPSVFEVAAVVGSQARALYEANRQLTRDALPPWNKQTPEVRQRYCETTQRVLEQLRFGVKP